MHKDAHKGWGVRVKTGDTLEVHLHAPPRRAAPTTGGWAGGGIGLSQSCDDPFSLTNVTEPGPPPSNRNGPRNEPVSQFHL